MRTGSVYVEILVAVGIFSLIMIPLIGGFQTGVRQTKVIRSHASSRFLAEWALAQTRGFIQAGTFEDLACSDPLFAATDLAGDARTQFPGTTAPLFDLQLTRTVSCVSFGAAGVDHPRLYQVDIEVHWKDPGQPQTKELRLRSMEGEDL